MTNLLRMVQSLQLDLRLTSGEAIAIILEHGRAHDPKFLQSHMTELKKIVSELASSNQSRTVNKTDRKKEQNRFRPILKYLEEGTVLGFQLRFAEEFHQLSTWSACLRYRKLCDIVGPGMTMHLQRNDRLRDLIPIGPAPERVGFLSPNLQYKLTQAAQKKSRTKEMKQNRLIRSDFLNN